MKITLTISVLLVTAGLAVYSCGGGETKPANDNTAATDPGAQLYKDNCVICHGEDGKAGMSGASDLSVSVLSAQNTIDVITNGRNTMRSFSSQFTKEEIAAIADHVMSLRAHQ